MAVHLWIKVLNVFTFVQAKDTVLDLAPGEYEYCTVQLYRYLLVGSCVLVLLGRSTCRIYDYWI